MEQAAAQSAAARIRAAFEALAPADLPRLQGLYTEDARFKDPFNEVRGVDAIRGIFQHMFETLQGPRFVIRDVIVQGGQQPQCFLSWDFHFRQPRMGPTEQCIRGASHLLLAEDGRIHLHRDYWDAAEELYEKIRVLGGLMRWLKKRAAS
jgi:ketosteroid isomerase-like protein